MIVTTRAYGMFSSVGGCGHPVVDRARAVKYMANRPAKNISSLASQTIVPTLTMFGRVSECTRDVSKVLLATEAVVTATSWHRYGVVTTAGATAMRQRDLPETDPSQAAGEALDRALGSLPVTDATVLVYSHRPEVREAVRTAVGRRPAGDVGPLTWVECDTGDEVVTAGDLGGIDLCILDGEAQPTGGLALSRQLKEEVADCPALCVLIARQPDRWLAHWSLADGPLPPAVAPLIAPGVVADLLREHAARPPG